jgi:hypothetical protein
MEVTLEAILNWVRGTPIQQQLAENVNGSQEDSGDAKNSLFSSLTPFDFSKMWQLLDTQSSTSTALTPSGDLQPSSNEYTGISIHVFFDSSQVSFSLRQTV